MLFYDINHGCQNCLKKILISINGLLSCLFFVLLKE